jgi:hypothetical protein
MAAMRRTRPEWMDSMANLNSRKGVIGILTGGGDVPGLNPAIGRAATAEFSTFPNEKILSRFALLLPLVTLLFDSQ